jgi:transcriptional repressor NrdR
VHCPYCDSSSTRVVDSRLSEAGDAVRRRRECEGCGTRFTTYERVEELPVAVIKRDGRREAFDRQKLLRGLVRAANKRPLSEAQLDELAASIAAQVRRSGPEVHAETIGDLCLRGLAELDPVTAILFASVYRNFADLSELEEELRRIKSEPLPGEGQMALDGGPVLSDDESNIASPLRRAGRPAKGKESTRREHAERA